MATGDLPAWSTNIHRDLPPPLGPTTSKSARRCEKAISSSSRAGSNTILALCGGMSTVSLPGRLARFSPRGPSGCPQNFARRSTPSSSGPPQPDSSSGHLGRTWPGAPGMTSSFNRTGNGPHPSDLGSRNTSPACSTYHLRTDSSTRDQESQRGRGSIQWALTGSNRRPLPW